MKTEIAHNDPMARRVRLRLLGEGWHAYGDAPLPDDRVIEVTEAEAAVFFRGRGAARRVEFLGWVEDDDANESRPDQAGRS
jgi:hypothetical protein